VSRLLAVCLVLVLIVAPAHGGNPTYLDGEINPEFKRQSFQTYVVGAVNAIVPFRKQLESLHVAHINRSAKNKQAGREFHVLFLSAELNSGDDITIEEIKQKLAGEGIQIFVFINVKDTGGANLTDVDTMDKALLAAANSVHDPSTVKHYGFTDVVLYELATGTIVWRGTGTIKAKPRTPDWFYPTSVVHAKYLVKLLRSSGLLVKQKREQGDKGIVQGE